MFSCFLIDSPPYCAEYLTAAVVTPELARWIGALMSPTPSERPTAAQLVAAQLWPLPMSTSIA